MAGWLTVSLNNIDILTGSGKEKLLSGVSLQRITVGRKSLYLPVQFPVFLFQQFNLVLLTMNGEAGLNPTEQIVPLEKEEQNEKRCHYNGIAQK